MNRQRAQREIPGPGQESVWDYPRPPRVEPEAQRVTITLGGVRIVDTMHAMRVLETSHPPVYYVPRSDILDGVLERASGDSWCEFKGRAKYLSVRGGEEIAVRAAWYYPTPTPGFEQLSDLVAIYPSMVDECTVGEDVVTAQEGDFYGGWITPRIVGPFKGGAGTLGW